MEIGSAKPLPCSQGQGAASLTGREAGKNTTYCTGHQHRNSNYRLRNYISDSAIRNAVLMDDDILTNPVEMGKMVETAVCKHITSFFYQKATRVGYYRVGRASKEIDIVVAAPSAKRILIEVKYREETP